MCGIPINFRFPMGNNALAVHHAGLEAEQRGYFIRSICSSTSEGLTEEVGIQLAEAAILMRSGDTDCLISGGEPVVRLGRRKTA